MKNEGEKRERMEERKKEKKEKMWRDSVDPSGSDLSHFEWDFLKF